MRTRILTSVIYIKTLSGCLFVSNERQNGPKYCVEHHMTPAKLYEIPSFKKLASQKIRFSLNFENPRIFSLNLQTSSFIALQCLQRQKCSQLSLVTSIVYFAMNIIDNNNNLKR